MIKKSLYLLLVSFLVVFNIEAQDLKISRDLNTITSKTVVASSKQTSKQNLDVKTYIPINAFQYLPILKQEQLRFWKDHPSPENLASLAEHESCVSLTSKKCWSPQSQLKSQREEGAGLFQTTRAYRKDGTLRFDTLTEMKNTHPVLSEWSWENVYNRPDLQIRAAILMSRDNYKFFSRFTPDRRDALYFGDAGYNGGVTGVQNERRACYMTTGCDPTKWFGHVELHCLKSKDALYGQRSACDINRHHVKDVFLNRSEKYKPYMM
jgi:hypothetical protein